jgi:hypothetical protein
MRTNPMEAFKPIKEIVRVNTFYILMKISEELYMHITYIYIS